MHTITNDTIGTDVGATVEKLVAGGKGLIRVNGEVLLVEGVVPGERILVRLGEKRRGIRAAQVIDVLDPSPDRVPPPCAIYGQCGGCQLQHLDYEEQLVQKTALLRDTLIRVGKLTDPPIEPIVPSGHPFGYRTHIRWTAFHDGVQYRLGFNEAQTHRVIEASACHLIGEPMRRVGEAIVERLAPYRSLPVVLRSVELRSSPEGTTLAMFRGESSHAKRGRQFLDLFRGIPDVAGMSLDLHCGNHTPGSSKAVRYEVGEPALWYPFHGLTLRISSRSFLQANWPVYEAVGDILMQWVGDIRGKPIVELYAGCGALGLSLARRGGLVTLVERNPFALADARKSADRSHVGRCRFRRQSAEDFLRATDAGEYELAVMDPPRTGLDAHVVHELTRTRIPRLVYLSCDAPTLARDTRRLQESGYRVDRVQPFDMFPHTAHVETLVAFSRS